MRYKNTVTAGFSLIELLVVVAIISLLAGLLFPVVTRARRQATLCMCVSNLRQLGTAVLMYADDHQGRLPRVCTLTSSGAESWGTMGGSPNDNSGLFATNATYQDLKKYVKGKGVFRDPAYKRPSDSTIEFSYRFNPAMNYSFETRNYMDRIYSVINRKEPKLLASCTHPRMFYIVSDRQSDRHMNDDPPLPGNQSNPQWQMPMVFSDGQASGNMRIYSRAWKDRLNQFKPYHWDFPKCHRDDAVVRMDY